MPKVRENAYTKVYADYSFLVRELPLYGVLILSLYSTQYLKITKQS
jgi:hypothetical protein